MHEYAIMCYLLEAVEEQARQSKASKVLSINLRVGERAGIDDSLAFYFEQMTPGTVVEGASLNIHRTTMQFYCTACDIDYQPAGANFDCPQCGTIGQMVADASELLIESIEIET